MAEFEAETFAEQAVLLGLITREQAAAAQTAAADGTIESVTRSLLRRGLLTSWQVERLLKADDSHPFFYGGCKVLFHIAEETFARVYRGERQHGRQSVAIKVLRRRFVTDPAAVARFNQEAEAGLKLVHPNIVRILEYGEQDKSHFMTMEYVEGSNLRDFLKIRHRLSPAEALPMMIGLAQGLKYALDQGVTHRDIKGTNILIGSKGVAKLVDFGLATIEGDEKKMEYAHGTRTVDYSALERTCGSPKGDPRSDIYFLGCVFYQMLTGLVPMPEVESSDRLAKMLKRSFSAIKPLGEHRHAPPAEVTAIIEKMMKMDLKHRYQSMDDVATAVEAYKEGLAKEPVPAPISVRRPAQAVAAAAVMEAGEGFSFDQEHKVFEPKNVLCVEVQDDIQNAFRKTLSQMGYRVLLVRDAEVAAERFRESPPDAVVFDADGQGPEALDAFLDMHEKAHEDGHDLAALVLLGTRQGHLTSRLPTDDRLVVLAKPIKMKDVQDAITQLVPLGE